MRLSLPGTICVPRLVYFVGASYYQREIYRKEIQKQILYGRRHNLPILIHIRIIICQNEIITRLNNREKNEIDHVFRSGINLIFVIQIMDLIDLITYKSPTMQRRVATYS